MYETVSTVIGFDLGHGETALARGALDGSDVLMLELNNEKHQPTAIAYNSTGEAIIGEAAFRTPYATELNICFKERPARGGKYGKTILDFVQAVYQHLIVDNQIQEGFENHFFVGCPTGWNDKEKGLYEELFRKSAIPCTVVRESLAAFKYAKERGLLAVEDLQGPVLVIDMGSSTTDFTLVIVSEDGVLRVQSPFDSGFDLGSSLIDRAILAHSLREHHESETLKLVFEEHPHYRNMCELLCRKAKEDYFKHPEYYLENPVWISEHPIDTSEELLVFSPSVSGPVMESILEQGIDELDNRTWPEAFHDILVEMKQCLNENNLVPSAVFLTGGASRMDFVVRQCREVFSSSLRVIRDSEPEFAIARGLVYWGRVDINMTNFLKSVDEFVGERLGEIVTDEHILDLFAKYAKKLAEGLVQEVLDPFLQGRRKTKSMSEVEFAAKVNEEYHKWLRKHQREVFNEVVNDWIKALEGVVGLEHQLTEIYQVYGLPYEPLRPRVDFRIEFDSDLEFFGGNVDGGVAKRSLILGAVVSSLAAYIFLPAGVVLAGLSLIISIKGPLSDKKIQKILREQKIKLTQEVTDFLSQNNRVRRDFIGHLEQSLKEIFRKRASNARELI